MEEIEVLIASGLVTLTVLCAIWYLSRRNRRDYFTDRRSW